MSRYLLLFILNFPFVLAAMLSAITQYKLRKITRKRMIVQMVIWVIILIGLSSAYTLYHWLFSHNLTESEPLSLFDVIQITGIVITFYIANRTRAKADALERRVNDLHQALSIKLSKERT